MKFNELELAGCFEVEAIIFEDDRGWFMRTFCEKEFDAVGFQGSWVQTNQSYTKEKHTIRGLHFQNPPHEEIKLVRCISGAVFDVVVDMREGSLTYGKWTALELSASKRNSIYIPAGFAHGFQTLTNDCELVYCHSQFYAPDHENGVRHDDPSIAINWPHEPSFISSRDRELPLFKN